MTGTQNDESKTENSRWDFSRMFRFPEIGTESLMAAQRRNLEAMNTAGKVALEGAQEIAKRQAEMVRSSMERTVRSAREIASAETVSEKIAKHADASKATFEKGVANAREFATMLTRTGEGVFDVVSRRVSEGFDEVREYATARTTRGGDSPTDDGGNSPETTPETTPETSVEKDAA